MLLRRAGDAVIAIGQPAHAWVSGQLARAWGNELFGGLDPREEVCLAAEQHDVGMAAWDAAPTLNPQTGLPHSFVEMPLEEHARLWSHAYELLLPQSRYAALLVSMHGTSLYEMRDLGKLAEREVALVREYLAGQRTVQEHLLDKLREDPVTAPAAAEHVVTRNRRLLWSWDAFSLALCLDWAPYTLRGVPAGGGRIDVDLTPTRDERTLVVQPWPFATDDVRLRCEGRRLDGRFRDEREMRTALAAASWETLELRLVAGAARPASP
jgi:hypothetical protein